MADAPEELHARVQRASGADGRLPLSRMTGWEIFPFEPDGLHVVPLLPPRPEVPRFGEDPATCRACGPDPLTVWSDDHWRVSVLAEPTGAPLVLVVQPYAHHDLPDLPDERAAELGVLLVHLARAVEGLPHVARAHVSRWGDGGAHLHVFVYARPTGFPQLRGSCFPVWDDLLPPPDRAVRDADAAAVAGALAASYGGRAASS